MKTNLLLKGGTVGIAALLLISAGSAVASAAEDEQDAQGVDVNVEITSIEEPGILALSIAGSTTSLAEDGSTELLRQFTGTLPTVTVTDTRAADEIADGAAWAVVGSASDFSTGDGGEPISAANLGWEPALIQGDGESFISVGDDVATAVDGGLGLVDQELLYLGETAEALGGTWSANADLTLRVPADVAPGTYTSVLTLSLFE